MKADLPAPLSLRRALMRDVVRGLALVGAVAGLVCAGAGVAALRLYRAMS